MSSRAFLLQCRSAEAAQSGNVSSAGAWCMKWSAPIFWYGAFAPEDQVDITTPQGDLSYPTFFLPVAQVEDRLAARKQAVLNLIPDPLRESYSQLYDAFAARIGADFYDGLLFDVADIFEICEFDPGALQAFPKEIALIDAAARGEAQPGMYDFSIAGAFNIGGEPAPMWQSDPVLLAREWRLFATGGPLDDESWPDDPTGAEIELAAKLIGAARKEDADVPSRKAQKPSWKFWA